jgi:DNA transposition AAA+ family ATPase
MASENAKAVAQEVISRVRKGTKVNLGEIIQKQGYADKVTKTKAYQEIVTPFVQQLEQEIQRAIDLLPKTISKAKYRDLVDGIDKLVKNYQLLSGKATSNVAVGYKNMSDDELYRLANSGE